MLVCYDPYVGTINKFSRTEIINMVAEAGYEGINLPIQEPFIDGTNKNQIGEIEKLLERHNLAVPSIGFGNHIVTTPSLRNEAMQHFKMVLAIAKQMNASVIGIWPNQPEDVQAKDALEVLIANLLDMLPEASEANISIALEFEKESPLDSYIHAAKFIKKIDSRIRLTCDTYHLNNDEADPYKSIIEMGKLVSDVHISGSHRGEPNSAGDTFEYKPFMKGLKEISYDGPLTAQYYLKDIASIARVCSFIKNLRDEVS